jgi:hypothetical protein
MPEQGKTQKCCAEESPHRETSGREFLDSVAERLVAAGERAGLTGHDLITLLESGMSIRDLIDYLAAKVAGGPVEN